MKQSSSQRRYQVATGAVDRKTETKTGLAAIHAISASYVHNKHIAMTTNATAEFIEYPTKYNHIFCGLVPTTRSQINVCADPI